MARGLRRSVGITVSGAYRGVSFSGLEFAATILPGTVGTNFMKFDNTHYEYVASKGFNVVRLAVLWERIQPTLSGELDATYKGYIDENIAWALANGLKIILDVHNFGRRGVSGTSRTIGHADGVLTQAHFASLWSKLSTAYKGKTTILAYGLMNEPHDMPVPTSKSTYNSTSTWTLAAQAAIDEIRATGDSHIISVCLDKWAGIRNFATDYGAGADEWINDNNYWIEAHCYFDSDSSGTYTASTGSHFTGSGRVMGEAGNSLETLASWCRGKDIPLFIGEFGIPKYDEGYKTALNDFMNVMDTYGVHGAYWAMGGWYTSITSSHPGSTYTDDREQLDILVKHV